MRRVQDVLPADCGFLYGNGDNARRGDAFVMRPEHTGDGKCDTVQT